MLLSTGLKIVAEREHISHTFGTDLEMVEDTLAPKRVSKSTKKRKRTETLPKKSEKKRAK